MLIIVIAFVIMGISSFLFASRIEHGHLTADAENTLAYTEMEINASLLVPETFLIGYSETIRSMILNGYNLASISSYMSTITNIFLGKNEKIPGFNSTHGYFMNWGGLYILGADEEQIVYENPQELHCYQAAIDAEGQIVISEPYFNLSTGANIITFSRLISDGETPIAVICLDVELSIIYKHAITVNLTESSYGIILSSQLEILAHPEKYLIGKYLRFIDSGLAALAIDLEPGVHIKERKVKNYMYEDSVVYFKNIRHGWFLGIVIPVNEYYKSVNNMAAFLIVIGTILACALCIMLYFIAQSKIKSDMRTQQKSNFLATMSHEIRTPLNAILGMTEIQMQNISHPPSTSEAFIKINNSGNLLLSIINDILDLSKIEAGKLEIVPVKYEVSSLINDIIQLNYIRYESKPIEFVIDIDENIPSVLMGDELRIKQILNNLLSNAFKYTDRGEVTLNVNAECVGRGGGAVIITLIFQVTDTGHGMTPDQVSRLFDEYIRFNLEANRTTEGAGLGMTITRNLVNLMYGKINVKSAIGEGTTVTVRLPQKTDGIGISGIIGKEVAGNLKQFKLGNTIQLKKTHINHEYMPYGRVLIVDDVETNLYVAKGLMAPYGLQIDLVSSGFEAIDKIKEGTEYDIIFMDHMMPRMDGIETTKQLRNSGYTAPIVALTANAISGQAEMFLKNGFDDFISKPIDIRQLNASLNRLIRDKQSSETLENARNEKLKRDDKKEIISGYKQVDSQLEEIFSRDAKKAIDSIKTSMNKNLNDQNDLQMYIINVHAMKSALANISENALSNTALRLEQAGREKNINVILTETGDFLNKLNDVINEIKRKTKDNVNTEDSKDSLADLQEKLNIIKEACSMMDKKTAKNALNQLREKQWSNETWDILNLISEHLLHSEFDEVSALIDKQKQ